MWPEAPLLRSLLSLALTGSGWNHLPCAWPRAPLGEDMALMWLQGFLISQTTWSLPRDSCKVSEGLLAYGCLEKFMLQPPPPLSRLESLLNLRTQTARSQSQLGHQSGWGLGQVSLSVSQLWIPALRNP